MAFKLIFVMIHASVSAMALFQHPWHPCHNLSIASFALDWLGPVADIAFFLVNLPSTFSFNVWSSYSTPPLWFFIMPTPVIKFKWTAQSHLSVCCLPSAAASVSAHALDHFDPANGFLAPGLPCVRRWQDGMKICVQGKRNNSRKSCPGFDVRTGQAWRCWLGMPFAWLQTIASFAFVRIVHGLRHLYIPVHRRQDRPGKESLRRQYAESSHVSPVWPGLSGPVCAIVSQTGWMGQA